MLEGWKMHDRSASGMEAFNIIGLSSPSGSYRTTRFDGALWGFIWSCYFTRVRLEGINVIIVLMAEDTNSQLNVAANDLRTQWRERPESYMVVGSNSSTKWFFCLWSIPISVVKLISSEWVLRQEWLAYLSNDSISLHLIDWIPWCPWRKIQWSLWAVQFGNRGTPVHLSEWTWDRDVSSLIQTWLLFWVKSGQRSRRDCGGAATKIPTVSIIF